MSRQFRQAVRAVSAALLLGWSLSLGSYWLAGTLQVTPATLRRHVTTTNFASLSPAARGAAMDEFARQMAALSVEERRLVRAERLWARWFEVMTEKEKTYFVEATTSVDVEKLLASVERLPEPSRQRVVDESLKRVLEFQGQFPVGGPAGMNAEMRQRLLRGELRELYSQFPPEIKSELAPLIDEMRLIMGTGRELRDRPPRPARR